MINNSREYDAGSWNDLIASFPNPHVLQSWEWGQVKSGFGWYPLPKTWVDDDGRVVAAAMILLKAIPMRGLTEQLKIMYVPKGPLLDWNDSGLRRIVCEDLSRLAQENRSIFVKIDPDVELGRGIPGQGGARDLSLGRSVKDDLLGAGWQFSRSQIQFRNTLLIDLSQDTQDLLAGMKQKTRYNVRLAGRKGVSVRVAEMVDLDMLYQMYAETAARDDFVIRPAEYYKTLWGTFMQAGMCEPLIAEVGGEPVAGVVIFRFAGTSWYLFGMSRSVHREKMPSHLLQWEAMRRAKEFGCNIYDMWGTPDVFKNDDPMWGVYKFKIGFGGEVVRHIGAWDKPVRPMLYRLYTQVVPRALDVLRWRGKRRTRNFVE